MRIAVLSTSTRDVAPIINPLQRMGFPVTIFYDKLTREQQENEILPTLVNIEPEYVVMVGAIEKYFNAPVPSSLLLKKINERFKTILICFDAGDYPWHVEIEKYHANKCFTLITSIDGSRVNGGISGLSPIDELPYGDPYPWNERNIIFGFAGNIGYGPRKQIIQDLTLNGDLTLFAPHCDDDFYVKFVKSCKGIINHPMTGSGEAEHVKGRVVQAGLAGSVLFEKLGPTREWFVPGKDYFEYETLRDVQIGLDWLKSSPEEAEEMAANLRQKVIRDHTPIPFWTRVFSQADEARLR